MGRKHSFGTASDFVRGRFESHGPSLAVFVVGIPITSTIYLQVLGGIWILQTVPAIVGSLYTR